MTERLPMYVIIFREASRAMYQLHWRYFDGTRNQATMKRDWAKRWLAILSDEYRVRVVDGDNDLADVTAEWIEEKAAVAEEVTPSLPKLRVRIFDKGRSDWYLEWTEGNLTRTALGTTWDVEEFLLDLAREWDVSVHEHDGENVTRHWINPEIADMHTQNASLREVDTAQCKWSLTWRQNGLIQEAKGSREDIEPLMSKLTTEHPKMCIRS